MILKHITFGAIIAAFYVSLYFPDVNPLAQTIGLELMTKITFLGGIVYVSTQIEAPNDSRLISKGLFVEHTISALLRIICIGVPLLGLWAGRFVESEGTKFIGTLIEYGFVLWLYLEAYSLFFNAQLGLLRGIGIHDPIEPKTASRYDRFFYIISGRNSDRAGWFRIAFEILCTITIFVV